MGEGSGASKKAETEFLFPGFGALLLLDIKTLACLSLGLQQLLNSPVFSLVLGITPGFPGAEVLRLGMDHRAAHKGLYLAEAHHHTDEPPKSREPILPIHPLSLLLIHLSEEPRLSDLGLWLLRFLILSPAKEKDVGGKERKTRERKTSHCPTATLA